MGFGCDVVLYSGLGLVLVVSVCGFGLLLVLVFLVGLAACCFVLLRLGGFCGLPLRFAVGDLVWF